MLYRAEIRSKPQNFIRFGEEEKFKILNSFEEICKIEDIHTVVALLDPSMKNLKIVNEFLDVKEMTTADFILKFSENFKIQLDQPVQLEQKN